MATVPTYQRDYKKERRALLKKWGRKGLADKRKKHRHARAALGLKSGDKRHADHINPIRHGGGNSGGNLRAVSAQTNLRRKKSE